MKRHPARWDRETGAALLSVLLLVAVMAVIAAVMLDRTNLAVRLAANSRAMTQARLYALSAESIVTTRVQQLVALDRSRTVDRPGLLGREHVLPLALGTVAVRIEDGGNCFNVNALVRERDGDFQLDPATLEQMRRLMATLDIPAGEAITISDAITDWIDSDDVPLPNGAEDGEYLARATPYRTAGRLITELSELRAVRGVTPEIYQRLRPWLCVLPSAEPAVLNLNTLRPEQARLVAALAPSTPDPALMRQIVLARPEAGYGSVDEAIRPLTAAGVELGPGALRQLGVSSRWFDAQLTIAVDSVRLEERVLIDTGRDPARIVSRSWGEDG